MPIWHLRKMNCGYLEIKKRDWFNIQQWLGGREKRRTSGWGRRRRRWRWRKLISGIISMGVKLTTDLSVLSAYEGASAVAAAITNQTHQITIHIHTETHTVLPRDDMIELSSQSVKNHHHNPSCLSGGCMFICFMYIIYTHWGHNQSESCPFMPMWEACSYFVYTRDVLNQLNLFSFLWKYEFWWILMNQSDHKQEATRESFIVENSFFNVNSNKIRIFRETAF